MSSENVRNNVIVDNKQIDNILGRLKYNFHSNSPVVIVATQYMYTSSLKKHQNLGDKITQIVELLNILKSTEILILEWETDCKFEFNHRSKINVFDDLYNIGSLKYNNGSIIKFKDRNNFFKNNYIDCLIKFDKLDYFCDELEKRIIGTD